MYDKDEIKNSLSLEQVVDFVVSCGASYPTVKSEMFMVENICHNLPGESKKQRLLYYENTKLFRCYTDCGDIFDIFELAIKVRAVQHQEEWTMGQAVRHVAQFFGIQAKQKGFDDEQSESSSILSMISRLEKEIHKHQEPAKEQEIKIYDETILSRLPQIFCKNWLDEGITRESMIRFGIKYYPTTEKIVIPHYNEIGQLIGIRGRALVSEEAQMYGKYSPLQANGIMYNHPLSFALYGLYENKENIRRMKKVIIFEGEKSVLLFESIFGKESNIAVACCGSNISSHQINLLLELGVEEVIIAFDRQFQAIGDNEFKHHTRSLQNLVSKFEKRTKVTIIFDKWNMLKYKDAPIDCGRTTFLNLYSKRISI